jgi:hypothetical protein
MDVLADLPPTGVVVAVALAAVLFGLILARVGRTLGTLLLVLGLVALAGLLTLALFRQSRATAAAATAAAVATTGQAVSSVTVTLLTMLLVVAVLSGGGMIGYLYLRLRRAERRGRWLPGPNARWGRAGEMPSASWWMYVPPPPAWWGYPPQIGMGYGGPTVYVIDEGDEEPDLDALPWGGKEWEW